MIKLLIGGSPCTYWSIAQKNNRETQAEGQGWELFKNYLIAKEKFKPDIFLYENNKSASDNIKNEIKKRLDVYDGTFLMEDSGARYIEINSALVSGQNRQRFYIHNCGDVKQPEDREILLKDILESGVTFRNEKSQTIDASYYKGGNLTSFNKQSGKRLQVAESIKLGVIGKGWQGNRLYSVYGKAISQTSQGGGLGRNTGIYAVPLNPLKSNKARCVTAGYSNKGVSHILSSNFSTNKNKQQFDCVIDNVSDKYCYEVKNGKLLMKNKEYKINLPDGFYCFRKLSVTECCRLQTMPDDYCRAVSNSQAYKGLGNGWTAEVIIHILQNALKNIPKDEEIVVLSMYDGIGTGRYCLDKMGFKNVKYYAYEIDKYAIKIAKSNYEDIIECGDAYNVRKNNWRLGE